MGKKMAPTKALRETRVEIERLGGVYLGAEPLKKHVIVHFTVNGAKYTEMISNNAHGRYDAPDRRRTLRQRFAREARKEN